jgi:hypothetical protein
MGRPSACDHAHVSSCEGIHAVHFLFDEPIDAHNEIGLMGLDAMPLEVSGFGAVAFQAAVGAVCEGLFDRYRVETEQNNQHQDTPPYEFREVEVRWGEALEYCCTDLGDHTYMGLIEHYQRDERPTLVRQRFRALGHKMQMRRCCCTGDVV